MITIRSIAIIVSLLLMLPSMLVISGEESSDPSSVEGGQETNFIRWIRDQDQNGIDDLLDARYHENPEQRVPIFVRYDHHPTDGDIDRAGRHMIISYVSIYVDVLCALDVPVMNVYDLVELPGVTMIEEQLPLHTDLDISNPASKARQSQDYPSGSAWSEYSYRGRGVTVAVLDTGVDDSHPTFNDTYLGGYNAVTGLENNPEDSNGHGSHVAGIILGQSGGDADPENAFLGVAPEAKLVDVKVQETNTGLGQNFVRGIDWCIQQSDDNREWDPEQREYNGIDIISVSLGDGSDDDGNATTAQAVNTAVEHGITVICAAGNNNGEAINAPGSADRAITVGASNDNGTIRRDNDGIWTGSNYGPRESDGDTDEMDELKPDVVAPGVDITSASNNYEIGADYSSMTGTSQATPHVAGLAALILCAKPYMEPDNGTKNVKRILRRTSWLPGEAGPSMSHIDDDWNKYFGWGIIDAYSAVRYAVTDSKIQVQDIRFQDDTPNEGDKINVEIRITETNGVDCDDGIIKAYKNSIGSGNLIYEEPLEGLRGHQSKTRTINQYRVVGGENKVIVTVTSVSGAADVEDEETVNGNYKPNAVLYVDGDRRNGYDIPPDQTVYFHGNASSDPEHDSFEYKFDLGDGTIQEYSSDGWINHEFENGRYTVKLYIKDQHGAVSNPDECVVTANIPPSAEAGDDIIESKDERVEFSGTAYNEGDHDDPNDDIILYEWDFDGDGEYEFQDDYSGLATTTYTDQGTFDVYFRVTDKWGAQAEDNLTVTIVEGQPPEIDAGEKVVGLVDTTISFYGEASDEDGTIDSYKWDFGDGTGWYESEGPTGTHKYTSHGTYDVRFKVMDNDGNEVRDTTEARIHRKPNAVIGNPNDEATYNSNDDILFRATGSSDPDGSALSYRWISDLQGEFGDEFEVVEMLHYGRHTITLEVTDADGAMDSTSIMLNVKDADDNPPTVNILQPISGKWYNTREPIVFLADGSDPDDDPLTYTWDIEGKSYEGKEITVTLHNAGEQEIWVTVADGRGAVDQDMVTLRLNTPPISKISGLQASYIAGEYFTLDASKSTDADGDNLTYTWTSDLYGPIYSGTLPKYSFNELQVGLHNLTLTVEDSHNATNSSTGSVLIKSEINYGVSLTASKTTDIVTFLKAASFVVEGENTGGEDKGVILNATNVPIGWNLTFWSGDEQIFNGLWSINGKSKNVFEIRVECPRDAQLGNSATIKVVADMGKGITSEIEIHVTVGVFRFLDASINAQSMLIDTAGDSIVLEFSVLNRGNSKDTVKLGNDAPKGWKVTYDTGDSIDLNKGESKKIKVTIKSPKDGKQGDEIILTIYAYSSSDSNANASVETKLKITSESESDSPGFEFIFLVVALMIPVVWRSGKIRKKAGN